MGMTLYDIDAQIDALDGTAEDDMLIDQETGELISVAQALDALRMEREAKLENVACWVKNLCAEADAIREEENRLVKRRKAAETKAANLKAWLLAAMTREDGTTDKLKTGRVMVSVKRNPPSTVVDDESLLPLAYKTVKQIVIQDKAAIKSAILSGDEVPGAHLEYGRSVIIK
ncbi:MAG: siphovirus Gp157 family protein [Aristaeellaceae bacterium]